MKPLTHIPGAGAACLLSLLLVMPMTATAQQGAAAPAPTSRVEARGADRRISIEFHGSLREALKKLAEAAGINLVVTGDLERPAEVFLQDVPAREALVNVARAYGLRVEQHGSIWTLRPDTEPRSAQTRELTTSERLAPMEPAPQAAPSPRAEPAPLAEAPGASTGSTARPNGGAGPSAVGASRLPVPPGSPEPPRPPRRGPDRVSTGGLTIGADERVGDAVAYMGDLVIRGRVDGDAVAMAGDIHLEATASVRGDVVSLGGNVHRADGARIDGDVIAMASGMGSMISEIGRKVRVRGFDGPIVDVDQVETRWERRESRRHHHGFHGLPAMIVQFAVLFGIGFLSLMFAPSRMGQIGTELRREPLKCGLTGLAGGLALIPLSVLLAITVIGIPFVAVLWILVGLGVAMGFTAFAMEIGGRMRFLKGRHKTQATVLAVGVLLLVLVGKIPVVGPLTLAFIGLVALGSIIRTRFGGKSEGVPQPL